VLVDRTGRDPGQWLGKSPWLQSVWFAEEQPGDYAIGDIVEVTLGAAGPVSLQGLVAARA